MVIAVALLLFANSLSSKPVSLVPALQQSYLLTVHVASAVVAYGAFTTGFAAALLYLFQARKHSAPTPQTEILDDMSYKAVLIGFPFLTLLIVLGALWADVGWGSYWSWDPKETASLVTWLFFAAYLHTRVMRNWKGSRAAILLIIGFLAVIFTFFGNYLFTGLHTYG
jgi:cytochrome c-type biogenesis protein CcsB